jgi:hypothetical protein
MQSALMQECRHHRRVLTVDLMRYRGEIEAWRIRPSAKSRSDPNTREVSYWETLFDSLSLQSLPETVMRLDEFRRRLL